MIKRGLKFSVQMGLWVEHDLQKSVVYTCCKGSISLWFNVRVWLFLISMFPFIPGQFSGLNQLRIVVGKCIERCLVKDILVHISNNKEHKFPPPCGDYSS